MASEQDFIDAVNFTIAEEGGAKYTDDPNDPGGPTKFGISKKAHPNVDIKNLTREGAVDIYRKEYWIASGAHRLPRNFALALFDYAVLSGPWTAVVALQSALGTTADGIVGMRTIAATWWLGAKQKLDDYLLTRMFGYFYNSKPEYMMGHCRRVLRVKELISK